MAAIWSELLGVEHNPVVFTQDDSRFAGSGAVKPSNHVDHEYTPLTFVVPTCIVRPVKQTVLRTPAWGKSRSATDRGPVHAIPADLST